MNTVSLKSVRMRSIKAVSSSRLLRVHTGSRLIQQQQLRLGGKRAGDLHPALQAVGQAGSQFVAHILKAQHMQQVFALLALTLFLLCIQPEGGAQQVGRAAAVLGDEHVLKHGLALPQTDILEGAGNAHLGDLIGRGGDHVGILAPRSGPYRAFSSCRGVCSQ